MTSTTMRTLTAGLAMAAVAGVAGCSGSGSGGSSGTTSPGGASPSSSTSAVPSGDGASGTGGPNGSSVPTSGGTSGSVPTSGATPTDGAPSGATEGGSPTSGAPASGDGATGGPAAIECSPQKVKDAPKLTVAQAEKLVGKTTPACQVYKQGTPGFMATILSAHVTKRAGWVQEAAMTARPMETKKAKTDPRSYVQVDGKWVEYRVYETSDPSATVSATANAGG